ncbi:DUF2470 domain-containing protein [Saccharomonospora sp. NPDC006951]
MTDTEARRPPAPRPAERAKTIAHRHCPALLLPALDRAPGEEHRIVPLMHHVHDSGSVTVLLPDEHPLVTSAHNAERGELAMMIELTDRAPVALREPIRGLLWITGWVRPLDIRQARARAVSIATVRPDPRLLDIGHGVSMLRLTPASLVLADAEGTHSLHPPVFGHAEPDPFCHYESHWLRHLEGAHPDVVADLAKRVPEELRTGKVRPLGLDRHGLRLRVESASGDHDVRLAFSRPAEDPHQLAIELRKLVGCPFLAKT